MLSMALSPGMEFMIRLSVKPDARIAKNPLTGFMVPFEVMKKVAIDLCVRVMGVEAVYAHPTELVA